MGEHAVGGVVICHRLMNLSSVSAFPGAVAKRERKCAASVSL